MNAKWLVALTVLLFAGCGGDDDAADDEAGSGTTTGEPALVPDTADNAFADALFGTNDIPDVETTPPVDVETAPGDDIGPAAETTLEPDAQPSPDTGPNPDPPGPFAEYDDFDEDSVVWLHTDISGWDVTSTVTDAHINYDELCVFHTKAGQWPEVLGIFEEDPDAPMEGNMWIVARIEGVWYAATFDYLRPGDECKYDGYSPDDEGPGKSTFDAEPLSTWIPQPGEPVYLLMSTIARHEPLGPLHERSDFVQLIWP